MFLHNINPVLIDFGTLKLTYYGLAYAIGIILGVWQLKKINKKEGLTSDKNIDDIVVYSIVGIILGGRLGYVFFYKPMEYLSDPIDIFKTWEGGMSFHGGLIGLILGIFLYCKKYKIQLWKMADAIVLVGPIGLFLGRIANFINGELFGRPTDGSWGVIFPYGGKIPRHPSQLYEAFLEGVVLYTLLNVLYYKTDIYKKQKALSGAFLIGYGIFRSIAELFREPDLHIGYIGNLTMGQILCIPMIIAGIYLVLKSGKKT
ncbi:MAG: prolipoprotein diacylglyceryl transferase [Alphaproteobacteria bacterium]|nr:prolipoprotein diacylglyceryl transferase [Alphaproteobacteria bacterium]